MGNSGYDGETPITPFHQFPTDLSPSISDGVVTLSVNGLMNVLPESYVATFGIVQGGETAEIAERSMHNRVSQFETKLLEAGYKDVNIYVDVISFVPTYNVETEQRLFSKSYNEVPIGFESQKNVMIRYRKPRDLDNLIAIAARLEIYDLVKIDYHHNGLKSLKDSLRTQCLTELKRRADSYASMHLKLDTLQKEIAENFVCETPPGRYFSYNAFSRTFVKAIIKNPETLNERSKPVTRYYQPYFGDQFDVAINADIQEPVIQIMYQVKVRYHTDRSAEYRIITPQGDVKKVIVK